MGFGTEGQSDGAGLVALLVAVKTPLHTLADALCKDI